MSFGNTAPAIPRQRRDQGIGGYFRQASIDAPTEGITLSLLGGFAGATRIDEFGRDVGDLSVVGRMLGFSLGKRFSSTFRTDFELAWRRAATRRSVWQDPFNPTLVRYETELKHFSGMINFYHDFDRIGGRFLTPYTGIGLGVSRQQFNLDFDDTSRNDLSTSETRFALQPIAGFSINVTARNAFFFESRGFTTFENDSSNVFNETIFGWRHTF